MKSGAPKLSSLQQLTVLEICRATWNQGTFFVFYGLLCIAQCSWESHLQRTWLLWTSQYSDCGTKLRRCVCDVRSCVMVTIAVLSSGCACVCPSVCVRVRAYSEHERALVFRLGVRGTKKNICTMMLRYTCVVMHCYICFTQCGWLRSRDSLLDGWFLLLLLFYPLWQESQNDFSAFNPSRLTPHPLLIVNMFRSSITHSIRITQ